jgi:hypothetical protein
MYTYSDLKHIYDGRASHKYDRAIRGLNNCRVSSVEIGGKSYMAVTLYNTRIGIVDRDDVWMVTMGGWDTNTTRQRIWDISRVSITNDFRTTGLDNTTRMNGLPYSGALKWHGGRCINPEVAPVDKITTLKRSAVAAVTKKLRVLRALMLTMARCEMLHNTYGQFSRVSTACIDMDKLEDPDTEMAERLYGLGKMNTRMRSTQMDCAQRALAMLREHLYEDMDDAYETRIVEHFPRLKEAA